MPRSWAVLIHTVVISLLPASYAAAGKSTYDLRPQPKPGEIVRVEAQIEVGGDVKLAEEGKTRSLKMSVAGKVVYDEKNLAGRGTAEGARTVRYYRDAQAVIKIDEGGIEPKLRDDRRLIVADEADGRATLFSPNGPLTREELDLVDLPANSLLLDRLLPDQPVRVGDHWRHPDALMRELLGLDAVSENDTKSDLKEVTGTRARIEMAGRVLGAVGGVATEIEVKAKYRFDFNERRVTGIGLLVKEKRAIGHVNTGLDVVAKLQMALAPAEDGDELVDDKLAGVSLEPRTERLALECLAPTKKFRIYHGRDWHLMTDAGDMLALRYLLQGELVAQCNVSSLADVEPGKEPSLATFQHDLERSLGESFGRYVEASESTTSTGHRIYRVIVEGRVSDLPIQWHYFLVADRAGRLAVFAFTVESDLVERLGDADEALVSTIEFAPPPASGEPTRAASRRGATKR
ncbi:MAG TPA: hypothetical protein VG826_22030 [Pirellulales bacterium]|nr:hypothetical protein [Pirellulales bacterium]